MADPPADTSGSGTPITGRSPITVPTFTIDCTTNHPMTPAVASRTNMSSEAQISR